MWGGWVVSQATHLYSKYNGISFKECLNKGVTCSDLSFTKDYANFL